MFLGDLDTVESRISELKTSFDQNNGLLVVPKMEDSEEIELSGSRRRKRDGSGGDQGGGGSNNSYGVPEVDKDHDRDRRKDDKKLQFLQPSLNLRRQRMHTHFDDLVYSYFGSRLKDIVLPGELRNHDKCLFVYFKAFT